MDIAQFVVPTYNKIADAYANQYFHDLSDAPYIDKFLSHLAKGATILDIGCGNGNFTQYMHSKGYTCQGIDLSEEMLRIAKKRVPELTFLLKDMRTLDYQDESFDGLLVAYSLIHIPSNQIASTLDGFRRILKSKGVMLLITQKGKSDSIVVEPLKEGEKIFINFFTKERLTTYLDNAGFKIAYQQEKAIQDAGSLSDTVIYTIATNARAHKNHR